MFSLVSVSLSIQARCPHVTTAYDAIGQSQGTWDSLDICVHLGTLPPSRRGLLPTVGNAPFSPSVGPGATFINMATP